MNEFEKHTDFSLLYVFLTVLISINASTKLNCIYQQNEIMLYLSIVSFLQLSFIL